MANPLIIYAPDHGFAFGDDVYISWLDGVYYAVNVDDATGGDGLITETMNANSFYISTSDSDSEGSATTNLVLYDTTITEGYIQEPGTGSSVTISGLDHLEGEMVYAARGSSYYGPYEVSSGQITMPEALSDYKVGLPYQLKIKTMRLAVPQQETIQARTKRISEITTRLADTSGGRQGVEQRPISVGGEYRRYVDDLYSEFSEESRDYTTHPQVGHEDDGFVVIESIYPEPMTVIGTVVTFQVTE